MVVRAKVVKDPVISYVDAYLSMLLSPFFVVFNATDAGNSVEVYDDRPEIGDIVIGMFVAKTSNRRAPCLAAMKLWA